MNLKSPETLIAALLKNELTWDDFQIAFRFFNPRERLGILEKLDEILAKGAGTERPRTTL